MLWYESLCDLHGERWKQDKARPSSYFCTTWEGKYNTLLVCWLRNPDDHMWWWLSLRKLFDRRHSFVCVCFFVDNTGDIWTDFDKCSWQVRNDARNDSCYLISEYILYFWGLLARLFHAQLPCVILFKLRRVKFCAVLVLLVGYSISQEICTRFLLCCALLWLYIDWFFHIHQAYFTGTVAI